MSRQSSSSLPPDLRERLQEEPNQKRAELVALWERLGEVDPASGDVPDTDRAWTELQERLGEERREEPRAETSGGETPAVDRSRTPRSDAPARSDRAPEPASRSRLLRRAGLGALAVLLLVAGVWWSRPVEVTAPLGKQVTATLPDGSTVDLNSGTSLSYPRGFQAVPFVQARARTVRLDGEAFFEVEPGPRPFRVETFNARVEVVGTSFNVRARSRSETATQVTVASGRVVLSPTERPDASVTLQTPGETSAVTEASAPPSPPESTNVDRALVWRRNGFAVTDLSLAAVVRELERRYDVTIRLDDSVDPSSGSMSLYYPTPTDAETIVSDLCTARGLSYRTTRQGFVLIDE